jgi:hypothetical protein
MVRLSVGAAEWIRTTTVLRPPAPQAGASANSATAAIWGYFVKSKPLCYFFGAAG